MTLLRMVTMTLFISIGLLQVCWGEAIYDRQGDIIPPGAEFMEGVLVVVNTAQGREQSVIIGDSIYRVDENTIVKTSNGGMTGLAYFKPGTPIAFYALDGLLTKVMPALNPEETSKVDAPEKALPTSGTTSSPVRLEGGVWKN